MRMGISTPVVLDIPGRSAAWEREAGIAEIARIAEAADRLGFDHLTCSEHVAVAEHSGSAMLGGSRGTRYWDPLATLSYVAARTTRIRLCTSVIVLGYHHPLAIAKRYGTLDAISGGRVVLGVGVGTAREEFELLGASFADRGRRADDAMAALRAALGRREPKYSGTYYSFDGLVVEPHAVQPRMPLWVGGVSDAALRRATALGDGWIPAGLDAATLRQRLDGVDCGTTGFEVVVGTAGRIDPMAEPGHAEQALGELAEAGATIVQPRVRHESLPQYLDQLAALAELSCFDPA
ncbi:TIGR03619 family F420-dependent LLM class oxidoreductase [Nocardia concava]|uniref:TIGR03619 family F420-dependent LLM class oxidoreductase n=1 Tax=Nocardia concava TaxID=257281 RepID=UPI000592E6AB|nr:TIGR03619 family F420-dependent LLM class oxidoreductase [Nocardia concava]